MKVRCTNCGSVSSLDALIANESASTALKLAFDLSGDLGRAVLQYLGLFRPATSQLSFDRVAKILAEINGDIAAGKISRNHKTIDAPPAAWIWAINQALKARDAKTLTLPLKNHGYLYEILSSYKPPVVVPTVTHPSHKKETFTTQQPIHAELSEEEKAAERAKRLENSKKLKKLMASAFSKSDSHAPKDNSREIAAAQQLQADLKNKS